MKGGALTICSASQVATPRRSERLAAGTTGGRQRCSRMQLLSARSVCVLLLVISAAGCSDDESATPGRPQSGTSKALEAGADLLQSKAPIAQLDAYLDGFHFGNGDLQAQMEAHHYCGHLNQDVIQCVIYDDNAAQARLVGVEYIISGALFAGLPAEEKHLWHSHVHEVSSGQLIAPGIPQAAEHALMRELAGTYGKTWHTWHSDHQSTDPGQTERGHELPLGIPMLMMGSTQDGQMDQRRVAARDARFGVSSAAKRRARADIVYPPIDPEADAWQRNIVVRLQTTREPPRETPAR